MSLRRGLFSTLILATSLVAACSTIQPERSIGRDLDDANASLPIAPEQRPGRSISLRARAAVSSLWK